MGERSREFPDRPFVGVGVVVLGPRGVLLIRRGKPPREGNWSLPGGAQKLGETLEDCARREVMEETGLEVEIIGMIDVVDSINRDAGGAVRYHYTLVDFAARALTDHPTAAGDAADARWFDPAEISELGLWSETERVIRLAMEFAFPQ